MTGKVRIEMNGGSIATLRVTCGGVVLPVVRLEIAPVENASEPLHARIDVLVSELELDGVYGRISAKRLHDLVDANSPGPDPDETVPGP